MRKITILIIAISIFIISCDSGANSSNVSISQSAPLNDGGGGRTENAAQISSPQISLEKAADSQVQPTVVERKIIRNADLQIESNEPEKTQQRIAEITESKGGFVIESTQSSSDVKISMRDVVSMKLRVPAEKFGETLEEIRGSGNRIIVETVRGQDVTEEFVDIEARLKAKKALEEQFIEIMKRTNSVSEALNVQKELSNVRGEIEQIEGRKRFLENQTNLSTINIRIQTPNAFSASSSGFFYQLGQAFSNGFNFALNFILVLITAFIGLFPFLLFVVLPIYLVIRYFLKRSRKQKLASDIAKEEIREQ